MDLVHRRAGRPDRGGLLSDLADWVEATFDHKPVDEARWKRALTHGSVNGEPNYQRLEFLGDRVLGLAMAEWLVELFPQESEGMLSRRINILVSGASCAEVARAIGVPGRVRLDKGAQAKLTDSDNVLGDVVEALLAALYAEAGFGAARRWVRARWHDLVHRKETASKHPKAALQDWALKQNRGLPVYTAVSETGPDHLPCHTVSVRLGHDERSATAPNKREAETEAARLLLAALLDAVPPPKRKPIRLARAIVARPAP